MIVIEVISLLYEHVSYDVFIDGSFVCAEVFVGSKVFLGFFVERCDKESGILVVYLVEFWVVVASEWKFWLVETVADVDHTCVCKPFYASNVISVSCILSDLGNLESLILLCKES